MIIFVNVITVLARVMQKIDLKITIGKIIKVSKKGYTFGITRTITVRIYSEGKYNQY